MFTTVLMIEKPLVSDDVEMVTTLHGDETVSFVVLMQPRGDQDRLLRALDDVALGALDQVVHEGRNRRAARRRSPRGARWSTRSEHCGRRVRRRWAGSSSGTRSTC